MSVLPDLLIAVGIAWLALRSIQHCIPGTMVSGDAFMPIMCGWQQVMQGALRHPSQPIYGYGLCFEYAAAIGLSDGMLDLVKWTVGARMMAGPLTYLAARVLTPSLTGASLAATRVGALGAAMLVVRHPGIIRAVAGGTHGYLAQPWIALAVLGLGLASTRRARLALVVGAAAVPMAMMNHPYSLMLAAGMLAVVPQLLRHHGWKMLAVAAVPTGALSWRRFPPLQQSLGNPGNWEAMVGSDQQLDELAYSTMGALNLPVNFILAAGGLVLIGLAIRAPAGVDRRLTRGWGLAAVLAAASIPATALIIEYIRPYHVELLAPLLAVGVSAGVALIVDLVARTKVFPWSALVLAPLLAWGSWTVAALPEQITKALCPLNVRADTVAGAVAIETAIRADLEQLPPDIRVMTSNLQIDTQSHLDNVQPATLGLLLAGLSPERMRCCTPDEDVAWYWLVGTDGEDRTTLDRLFAEPGVDVLLGPPQLAEHLVAVRTPAARHRFRTKACEVTTGKLWSGHYETWMSWMSSALEHNLLVPPDPVDCKMVGIGPMPPAEELADSELLTTLAELAEQETFRWVRPPDPAELMGRPVLLHAGRCDESLIQDAFMWLDYYEPIAESTGIEIISILVDDEDREQPCGTEHGQHRAVGRSSEAEVGPELRLDEREFRLYDHLGVLRSTGHEHVQTGNEAALEHQRLLSKFDRERRAAREAAAALLEP